MMIFDSRIEQSGSEEVRYCAIKKGTLPDEHLPSSLWESPHTMLMAFFDRSALGNNGQKSALRLALRKEKTSALD